MPRTGGAVLASNHVSYLDFAFVGYGARDGRPARAVHGQGVGLPAPGLRPAHAGDAPHPGGPGRRLGGVPRGAGALKAGELVGVFPEATISRSFELKEFKAGAARMAQAAGVPLVPTVVWGGQRIYTKGRPRDFPAAARPSPSRSASR